jgi:hypothetical protein
MVYLALEQFSYNAGLLEHLFITHSFVRQGMILSICFLE